MYIAYIVCLFNLKIKEYVKVCRKFMTNST